MPGYGNSSGTATAALRPLLNITSPSLSNLTTSYSNSSSNMTIHCQSLNHSMAAHLHSYYSGSISSRSLAARSEHSSGGLGAGAVFGIVLAVAGFIIACFLIVSWASKSHAKAYAAARAGGRQGGWVGRGTMRAAAPSQGYREFGLRSERYGMRAPAPLHHGSGRVPGQFGRAGSRRSGPMFPGPRNGFAGPSAFQAPSRGSDQGPYGGQSEAGFR